MVNVTNTDAVAPANVVGGAGFRVYGVDHVVVGDEHAADATEGVS